MPPAGVRRSESEGSHEEDCHLAASHGRARAVVSAAAAGCNSAAREVVDECIRRMAWRYIKKPLRRRRRWSEHTERSLDEYRHVGARNQHVRTELAAAASLNDAASLAVINKGVGEVGGRNIGESLRSRLRRIVNSHPFLHEDRHLRPHHGAVGTKVSAAATRGYPAR